MCHMTLTRGGQKAANAATAQLPILNLPGLSSLYFVCFELAAANVSASQVPDKW